MKKILPAAPGVVPCGSCHEPRWASAGTLAAKVLGGLVTAGVMAACSQAAAPATIAVFHSLGSRQCQAGGVTPDELAERLRSAGVTVSGVSCGTDGLMRAAACGMPDGHLAVFDIAPEQRDAALAQGFRAWSDLPAGQRQACRKP